MSTFLLHNSCTAYEITVKKYCVHTLAYSLPRKGNRLGDLYEFYGGLTHRDPQRSSSVT